MLNCKQNIVHKNYIDYIYDHFIQFCVHLAVFRCILLFSLNFMKIFITFGTLEMRLLKNISRPKELTDWFCIIYFFVSYQIMEGNWKLTFKYFRNSLVLNFFRFNEGALKVLARILEDVCFSKIQEIWNLKNWNIWSWKF